IAEVTRRRIDEGRLWVWDDGGPVSAAGATIAVAGVARINFVYTPPTSRRRGYAGACVSALSARLLAKEAKTCALYAQLENPISNGIYRRIGYRPVKEILLYRFGGSRRSGR
ncbi:MAG: GNAT family N-acetyltransferase, partial [Actinobacteria bacterium]|nr:GNAT family N-acetyltransferase [Actinomycetota bacterium]